MKHHTQTRTSSVLTEAEAMAENRLQSAARTLRRLPDRKVQGYFNTWPTIIREPLEILQMEAEPMRIRPSPSDISEMEDVLFNWLPTLEPDERHLAWMRAERICWKAICKHFGVGRTKAWEMYRRALAKLAIRLHAKNR
jgi:hypothetical protein